MSNDLEDRLTTALHDLTRTGQELDLDLDAIERRSRRIKARSLATRGGITLTVMAVAAAAVGVGSGAFGSGSSSGGAPQAAGTTAPATDRSPLVQLADYVSRSASPSGDATEVIRTTTNQAGTTVGADLYADNGDYFYADDSAGLAAAVKSHANLANGVFGREVAIAKSVADGGDLDAARKEMAVAALDPGESYDLQTGPVKAVVPADKEKLAHTKVPVVNLDGNLWSNSLDGLVAGAGQPEVRAGVLRLLSGLSGVSVTRSATTMTITYTDPSGFHEALTLGADDAIPTRFVGGDKSGDAKASIAYQVKRVTLSSLR
jgi:hypothetical protein